MAEQLIRYHKRKLVDGRIDLFYWLWGGADVIVWFGANERLGNAARFGAAKPTMQDQDDGDKVTDYKSKDKEWECVECQRTSDREVEVSFEVESGAIDHGIIGGRTVALPFVDLKTRKLLEKFRGGVFLESTKPTGAPKKYFRLHGTGTLTEIPPQGETSKDEKCSHCGHTPMTCQTCCNFFNPCPICGRYFNYEPIKSPNASPSELMGWGQYYIDRWNGDDIINCDAPFVTGRVIEALIAANVKLFYYGPVEIEFAGASAQQKKWADKAARKFF